jgi:hypothetical protein
VEIIIFLVTGFLSLLFLFRWYSYTFNNWPPTRARLARFLFGWLPFVAFMIIILTLMLLASFDVVGFYILFYILIGYAWIYIGLILMSRYFDISWIDDALNLNNKAAVLAISGGFLGLTMIYAGANVGDGPGWWCVIFAGGLGLITWFILARIVNKITKIFERITVERNTASGIRLGLYLLAAGIILGKASSGDWTSFEMTIIEFGVGWPVLPLTILMMIVESYYITQSKRVHSAPPKHIAGSIFWGLVFIAFAMFSIFILPEIIESFLNNKEFSFFSGGIL